MDFVHSIKEDIVLNFDSDFIVFREKFQIKRKPDMELGVDYRCSIHQHDDTTVAIESYVADEFKLEIKDGTGEDGAIYIAAVNASGEKKFLNWGDPDVLYRTIYHSKTKDKENVLALLNAEWKRIDKQNNKFAITLAKIAQPKKIKHGFLYSVVELEGKRQIVQYPNQHDKVLFKALGQKPTEITEGCLILNIK